MGMFRPSFLFAMIRLYTIDLTDKIYLNSFRKNPYPGSDETINSHFIVDKITKVRFGIMIKRLVVK